MSDESAARAWQHGREDADAALAVCSRYGDEFPLRPMAVPVAYADGSDGILCQSYRGGYASRARYLVAQTSGSQ